MENDATKKGSIWTMKTNFAALVGFMLLSCTYSTDKTSNNEARSDAEDYRNAIKTAIMHGDAPSFASRARYPIFREYPLRDIEDSASMVTYFHCMADDSLKRVFEDSTLDDWTEIGWRGTTLYDGSYIWCDEGIIYAIPYQSKMEKSMLDSLRYADMATLPEYLISGWLPETCLVDSTGTVYRIDKKLSEEPDDSPATCRLLVYPKGQSRYKTSPAKLLYGALVYQGTASAPEYTFEDTDGAKWIYYNFWYENFHSLSIEKSDGDSEEIEIKKFYWLD